MCVCVCVRACGEQVQSHRLYRRCRVCRLPSCASIQRKLDRKEEKVESFRCWSHSSSSPSSPSSSSIQTRALMMSLVGWLGGWVGVRGSIWKESSSSSLSLAAANAERSQRRRSRTHYAQQHLSPLCVFPCAASSYSIKPLFLLLLYTARVCLSVCCCCCCCYIRPFCFCYWIARASRSPLLLLPLSHHLWCAYARQRRRGLKGSFLKL